MSSIDETLAERGSRYGDFVGHAEITQGIKDVMRASANWGALPNDMKEGLEMVAHKIGRILNGDPTYIDSWTDTIGYTRLVEKRLLAEQASVKADENREAIPKKPTHEELRAYEAKVKETRLKFDKKLNDALRGLGVHVVFTNEESGETD